MHDPTHPPLPLPEPLRGADPDSFAHSSVAVRLKKILRQTLEENAFSNKQRESLELLLEEIPGGKIKLLSDRSAPDTSAWDGYIHPYLGLNWLEAPWFFIENYFYRRILEGSGYFERGKGYGLDPFRYQKHTGFESSVDQIQTLCSQLNRMLESQGQIPSPTTAKAMLYSSLWGNQVDLSLWPTGEDQRPDHADLAEAQAYLLADDTNDLINIYPVNEGGWKRVDVLVDNAGFELVADLCLADYLLSAGICKRVRIHVKAHPTFVSDAVASDVERTIRRISFLNGKDSQMVGKRLLDYASQDRLEIAGSFFWNSPLPSWEMPGSLRNELSGSDLTISKGDANYRRFLGDRHWPYTLAFKEVMAYYPAPFLALRVMKSEVVLGLKEAQLQKAPQADPDWMVSGRWGLIQLKP
jgi:uncharacterized protein with ATP-grasp and redox domains